MSRKRMLGIMLVLLCVVLLVFYVGYDALSESTGDQPQHNPPELPEGPIFVVPENPLGVLGVIIACVVAFGIFAKVKRMSART